jgi:hypothetical protein
VETAKLGAHAAAIFWVLAPNPFPEIFERSGALAWISSWLDLDTKHSLHLVGFVAFERRFDKYIFGLDDLSSSFGFGVVVREKSLGRLAGRRADVSMRRYCNRSSPRSG